MEKTIFHQIEIQGQSKATGKLFPKCYGPQGSQNFISLQSYFQNQAKAIVSELNKEGALFFRGFDVKSAEEISSVINKLGLASFEYVGGAAVRKLIVGSSKRKTQSVEIFTTNEAPPQEPIPFHNQLLQNQNYPDYVSFFCYRQADKGGSTPLVSCIELYNYISKKYPEFLKNLQQLGVRYMRIVSKEDNPKSPIGRGWSNIFKVNTRQQAEQKMAENSYQWKWLNTPEQDCKLISKKLSAITISRSGQKVFCNQVLAVFKGWIDEKNSPAECLKFGDFSPLPTQIMEDIYKYAESIKASIDWKVGDFVLIDNQMAKHAREPYEGLTRKIFASLLKGEKQIKKGLHITLNSGDQLPAIGFGTWKLSKETAEMMVYEAIKAGYRLIDCAACYGNQLEVGRGINKAINQNIVERSDLWVTSKLWSTDHEPKYVRSALERTLKDLNLSYLNLYLVHWPIACKYVDPSVCYPLSFNYVPEPKEGPKILLQNVSHLETWRALQELHQEGLIRNIGVSNFTVSILRDLIYSSRIKPSVNQVQIHPQFPQKKLIRFCRENGIHVTSYSTMGGSSYVEINLASPDQLLINNNVVNKIAKKNKKTCPQVLFRWAVQQGISIIPKTSKVQRLAQNLSASDWHLEEEDMKEIDTLDKNKRYCDSAVFTKLFWGTQIVNFD